MGNEGLPVQLILESVPAATLEVLLAPSRQEKKSVYATRLSEREEMDWSE